MRHRTPQFGHIFSGDGYSAGYYSYLWADTLTADACEAFIGGGRAVRQGGGPALPEARPLGRQHGRSRPTRYRAFRGRDAGIDALMRDRGFPVPAAPKTD